MKPETRNQKARIGFVVIAAMAVWASAARAQTAPSFTVGGTVNGLASSGLLLQNNGADDLQIPPNGGLFTFATPVTGAYSVTVAKQPDEPPATCVVVNGSGTAAGNVADVQVNCTDSLAQAFLGLGYTQDASRLATGLVETIANLSKADQQMYESLAKAISDYKDKEASDIENINANISSIQLTPGPQGLKGDKGDPGAPGPAGGGVVIPRNAPANYVTQFGGFSPLVGAYLAPAAGQAPNLQVTAKSGGVQGSGIGFGGTAGASGSFFEYKIDPPDDGNYKIGAQMAITSGGVPLQFHYEVAGANISGPLTFSSPDTGPRLFETAPLALKAGPQILRVAIDAVPLNMNGVYIIYWLRIVKQ